MATPAKRMDLDPTAPPSGPLGGADLFSAAPWLHQLSVAAWTVDEAGIIVHCNREAAELLGGQDVLGRPCHEVVGAVGIGKELCSEGCPIMGSPDSLSVHRVELTGPSPSRWVALFTIPVALGARRAISQIHIAVDLSREHHWESYLRGVGGRRADGELAKLTEREREILSLLAEGNDADDIAEQLYLSPVTVRNHLHHIYAKLRVHSVAEAVARYLLSR